MLLSVIMHKVSASSWPSNQICRAADFVYINSLFAPTKNRIQSTSLRDWSCFMDGCCNKTENVIMHQFRIKREERNWKKPIKLRSRHEYRGGRDKTSSTQSYYLRQRLKEKSRSKCSVQKKTHKNACRIRGERKRRGTTDISKSITSRYRIGRSRSITRVI